MDITGVSRNSAHLGEVSALAWAIVRFPQPLASRYGRLRRDPARPSLTRKRRSHHMPRDSNPAMPCWNDCHEAPRQAKKYGGEAPTMRFALHPTYGPLGKAVEGCVRRIVAIVPVDLAFALLKSARVSTAGAIRARYHGSPRRVLFTASSGYLSQDARALASEGESNRDSFFAPEYQRGRRGDKTAKPCRKYANCTCCCAFQGARDITSGMDSCRLLLVQHRTGALARADSRCSASRETEKPTASVPLLVS
jgi:hypothetical protein